MKVSAADKGTGKSSSVTIENERGRLSQEEIDRVRLFLDRVCLACAAHTHSLRQMVAESEAFAEQDEELRKKIEARNALENCKLPLSSEKTCGKLTLEHSAVVYSLKGQLADDAGLGGKLDSADKKTINDEIKKTQDWLEEFGQTAEIADLDEQREALQAIVSPITSKIVRPAAHRLPLGRSLTFCLLVVRQRRRRHAFPRRALDTLTLPVDHDHPSLPYLPS